MRRSISAQRELQEWKVRKPVIPVLGSSQSALAQIVLRFEHAPNV